MTPVCVIGGSGFIGTRLVERLQRTGRFGLRIVDKVMSRDFPALTTLADVRDLARLSDAVVDGSVLIHLAAEHRDDVRPLSLYDEVNVQGARHIVRVAEQKGVSRIVFTSTVAVYGFAERGADESAPIRPFNAYGRTKAAAETILRDWQVAAPDERTLCIIRPTVVFGERNRGNVYNLFRQIASGRFVMIGAGTNRKSVAYVENVAAFIEHCLALPVGMHLYNYVDKPDFDMNAFVALIQTSLGRVPRWPMRLPYRLGLALGSAADIVSRLTGRSLAISRVRVQKFCADSVYESAAGTIGFTPPVPLSEAIQRTLQAEFVQSPDRADVFYSE